MVQASPMRWLLSEPPRAARNAALHTCLPPTAPPSFHSGTAYFRVPPLSSTGWRSSQIALCTACFISRCVCGAALDHPTMSLRELRLALHGARLVGNRGAVGGGHAVRAVPRGRRRELFEEVLRGLKERASTQQPERWTSAVSDNDRWSPGVVAEGPEAPPPKRRRLSSRSTAVRRRTSTDDPPSFLRWIRAHAWLQPAAYFCALHGVRMCAHTCAQVLSRTCVTIRITFHRPSGRLISDT